MRIPHEELLVLWKLETLRELKSTVSDLSLYIYELGDDDPVKRSKLEGLQFILDNALQYYRDILDTEADE